MDKNKTAFPYVLTNLNGDTEIDTGMTLRDYFANFFDLQVKEFLKKNKQTFNLTFVIKSNQYSLN